MTINDITYVDKSATPNKNVRDMYAAWETEAIKADLDTRRSQMVNVCMNLTSDFNKSSIVRSHNAFLGKEVIFIGKRRWDKRGAVGTYHFEHVKHCETIEPVIEYLHEQGYSVLAVDNIPDLDPQVIYDVELPEKTAFLYGEEQMGLTRETIQMCDGMVHIPQMGSVRSLNVGVAAGIMMSEYARRHRDTITVSA